MKRVATHAIADEFRNDVRAATLGVLQFFDHQNASSLTDNEPIALGIERT